jgi:hypothetical protein
METERWKKRVYTLLSSPSRLVYQEYNKEVITIASKAALEAVEYSHPLKRIQEVEEIKGKGRNRKNFGKGKHLSARDARRDQAFKVQTEKRDAIKRAVKAITKAENKHERKRDNVKER